jgi:hypothetical protein
MQEGADISVSFLCFGLATCRGSSGSNMNVRLEWPSRKRDHFYESSNEPPGLSDARAFLDTNPPDEPARSGLPVSQE